MTEVPEVPDEFDSGQKLKACIDSFHDQIEFVEEELETSEKVKLELKRELNEIQSQARKADSPGFAYLNSKLEGLRDNMERMREEAVDDRTEDLMDAADELSRQADKVGEETSKMEENRKQFKEEHSRFFGSSEDDNNSEENREDEENGGEDKSLADKVSEYENPGRSGSSPGDHT